ncbi:MAG TPA: hydrogenase maturation protease [Phycisphaerae bacterium]|nr:hydrogenase maturation protease [Phycisphaerae bacterium]
MSGVRKVQSCPVLVAGCGNLMAGDDGFGPLVVREVAVRAPRGVEVVDLGLQPAGLLDHLPGRAGVVVVDAVLAGEGVVYELLDVDCVQTEGDALMLERAGSSHAMGLAWQLSLARALGILPPFVRLIALSIPRAELGVDISEQAAGRVAGAVELVLKWAEIYLKGQPDV